MISDLDLWRAAMRADEFLDQGNLDGKRLWMRIMQTIVGYERVHVAGHADRVELVKNPSAEM